MRWFGRIAIALVLVLALTFCFGWYLLAGSVPQTDGRTAVAGLGAPATVVRDAAGVPTITASSQMDVVRALGFLHGQERFFQMDLMRRSAAGELSELLGKVTLDTDKNHRKHRFRALADRQVAQLGPRQRRLFDAYTAGVNAGLAQLAVRPWEYLLLGQEPRPWTDADTFLTVDAMFFMLNGSNLHEVNRARLQAVLPRPLVDFLLAPSPRWDAPLEGGPLPPVPMPSADAFDLRSNVPSSVALAGGHAAIARAAAAYTGVGSNGFAVGGSLTGGAALVASDPHLGIGVPSIWYRARMRYPSPVGASKQTDLNGLTLPGVPMMVIGSNGHIAWAFTNSQGDWMDWVRVRRDPDDASRYKTPNGWATIRRHDEVIHVKGAADVHLTVEDTIWGPIMAKAPDGTPLALAWTAHDARSVNANLFKLFSASTVKQALAVAPTIGMPPQNLVVADSAGNIGWTIIGSLMPQRAGFDPAVPADWSKPGVGWIGFATPAQYPRIVNPSEARIWTANQRIVGGAALKLIGDGGYDRGARAGQIRDDLKAREHFAPHDMLRIQLDDRALFLARWQQRLLHVLSGSHDAKLQALQPFVKNWQARAAADSVGYRIVKMFREQVRDNVLAPFAARASSKWKDFEWPFSSRGEFAVWTLLTDKPAWLLDPKYKSWNGLLVDSAREVADKLNAQPGPLSEQTWGRYNTAQFNNALSAGFPAWLAHFVDMPHVPLSGDRDMPHVMHPDFGASMRMDVQPGDEAHGILEMPIGQSDNPLSPWFGAGHQAWLQGRATPLLPGPAKYALTLSPAG